MKNTLAVLTAFAAATTGCYSKHLVLQADVVSMTKMNADTTKKLRIAGDVEETWCIRSDKPVVPGQENEGQVGMADQVIYKAQGGGKEADFITDARVWVDSNGCALLTGKKAMM